MKRLRCRYGRFRWWISNNRPAHYPEYSRVWSDGITSFEWPSHSRDIEENEIDKLYMIFGPKPNFSLHLRTSSLVQQESQKVDNDHSPSHE